MIRMIQSTSAGHAKAYFSDALQKSDYYLDNQELQGTIKGKIAERLNLSGPATKEIFFSLCENINPNTGTSLTPRTKDQRTIAYDINFHCPKSVSIVHALSKDDHILRAFEKSVEETMHDIEQDSRTRVRKDGKYEERETGELIWADFTHQTARPVDGSTPDPHLHSHQFVFNATWDATEKLFKAGQFRDIKMDMPYYQARFHKRLSDNLIDLGYDVIRTDKAFELAGVPQTAINLFSKRTDEIGRFAKEKGITDAKALSELGAKTRSKKLKGHSMTELKAHWRSQIQTLGNNEVNNAPIRYGKKRDQPGYNAISCLNYAISHCFERASVMADRRLLEHAYRHALGENKISIKEIDSTFKSDERIIHVKEKHRTACTTKEVLSEEKKMVQLARSGQNKFNSLYARLPLLKSFGQQAKAIGNILKSMDRVNIIRGVAGSGKTTLMTEAIKLIENIGKKVFVIAPTANASRGVLKDEGFTEADTVARFLTDKNKHAEIKDQVIWVDEAGLLGTNDMTRLLSVATAQNARLILSGDTRQHSSVIRGDALRILNTVAGIKTAEVKKIYRQKDFIYRGVVEDLSKGNVVPAFEKLNTMNAIQNVDPLKPHDKLVNDYVQALKDGKKALVISPTHKQGNEVTEAIRLKLKKAGVIGKKEILAVKLTNLNFTKAEKADMRNLTEGQIIKFSQNLAGIKRGSQWCIKQNKDKIVTITNTQGVSLPLPLDKANSFDVYLKSEIGLAKGDRIQINRNGYDNKEKRLNNGQSLEIVSVSKKGKILLKNPISKNKYEIDKDFGHITHAHCITSYASQGKTVDEVFIAQSSATFSATDAKQFYVSVSRAREKVTIYTDDRDALLQNASELGNRQSALELVTNKKSHKQFINYEHEEFDYTTPMHPEKQKDGPSLQPKIDMDYEPRF